MRFASTTRLLCLAVLVSLALTSSCAERDVVVPPDDVIVDIPVDIASGLDFVTIDATPATATPALDSSTLVRLPDSPTAPVHPSAACACSDDDCVRAWIQEQLGCDVCALIVCAPGHHVGGCVACPALTPPTPDPAP